jgi:hypothetical protein
MRYIQLKQREPEAFRRYCGVKPETFKAMLDVLEVAEENKWWSSTAPRRLSSGPKKAVPLLQ